MSGKISFRRNYAAYGDNVRPFERANDIGSVITEFLWYEGAPFYPFGDLVSATISSVWLGAGEPTKDDEDNLDLVFKMPESDGGNFFEIVLRSSGGTSYGGWAWGQDLEVTDTVVSGHRVLVAHANELCVFLEYSLEKGKYVQRNIESDCKVSTSTVRRLTKISKKH
ncbi:hypothetical protein FMN63_25800 [Stappia sp. BW2]|jgi:hypothetical protein|uniref:hypothetical protein n=1 Tax=Stappia sp. BW2 TaxID=2592622 RepID=UPI0011DE5A1C|nr:hypothetical protein [Stappia sp. BW2]TYC65783.1 hypothetical protein FMN63_25800 [Stappia sp. BW2]